MVCPQLGTYGWTTIKIVLSITLLLIVMFNSWLGPNIKKFTLSDTQIFQLVKLQTKDLICRFFIHLHLLMLIEIYRVHQLSLLFRLRINQILQKQEQYTIFDFSSFTDLARSFFYFTMTPMSSPCSFHYFYQILQ